MHRFKSSLIASIRPKHLMMILTAFTLVIAVFGGQARGDSIFVDAGANPGGDGSAAAPYQTITEAIAQAREIRQRKPHSKIKVHVAPGVYSEAFPIYLNVSNLDLRGSTKLITDADGLPTQFDPVTETLIAPNLRFPRLFFLIAPTTENTAGKVTGVTVSGFVIDGRVDNAIFIDRVDDFFIRNNVIRRAGAGIQTRLSSGKIQGNLVDGQDVSVAGIVISGGSEIYPARVKLKGNRVINNGEAGVVPIGAGRVKRNIQLDAPDLKPIQTTFDPDHHPEEVPDKLDVKLIGNDISHNGRFGLRMMSYNNDFYDTTSANQPMTSIITATVRGNTCSSNGEYGVNVEGGFTIRANPRKFTGTLKGTFEDNNLTSNGRTGAFFGFLTVGVVTNNPGAITQRKYLQDSRFDIEMNKEDGESVDFDYDNPAIDPFDRTTFLNNSLTVNDVTFTGKKITCPPGFPCAP